MEIRRLKKEDYDALLDLLNTSFAAVRNRPVDFLRGQPKMWVRDDVYMGRHLGLFEDGQLVAAVGIYPLELAVGNETLRFATTGNVATHPSCAGRGYFTKLFSLAMKEAELEGYDALRLGGEKQRYARFGFEDCGTLFRAELSEKNRAAFDESRCAGITFMPLSEDSLAELRYVRELTAKAPCYVKRYPTEGERDVLHVLRSKYSEAYIAKRAGCPIGYLSAADMGKTVTELRAESAEDYLAVACAWQRGVGETISLTLAPWMKEELVCLSSVAQTVTVLAPSKFKFLHPERVADAFLKLKHSLSPLPNGTLSLEIAGYGVLRLCVDETGASCTLTNGTKADAFLDGATAAKLLYGHLPPSLFADLPSFAAAWLPLPLSWNFQDLV